MSWFFRLLLWHGASRVLCVLCLAAIAASGSNVSGGEAERPLEVKLAHTLRFFNERKQPLNASAMAFSPSGEELAISTSGGRAVLVRVADGEQVETLRLSTTPSQISFSADGRLVTLSGRDGTVVYDRSQRKSVNLQPQELARGYIGLSLGLRNGKLLIESINPSGPAAKDGRLKVGMEVVGLASSPSGKVESVIGSSAERVMSDIGGPAGKFVDLQVVMVGESELDKNLAEACGPPRSEWQDGVR